MDAIWKHMDLFLWCYYEHSMKCRACCKSKVWGTPTSSWRTGIHFWMHWNWSGVDSGNTIALPLYSIAGKDKGIFATWLPVKKWKHDWCIMIHVNAWCDEKYHIYYTPKYNVVRCMCSDIYWVSHTDKFKSSRFITECVGHYPSWYSSAAISKW